MPTSHRSRLRTRYLICALPSMSPTSTEIPAAARHALRCLRALPRTGRHRHGHANHLPRPRIYMFFFTDTSTPEIYTLSLHDALPILEATDRVLNMVKQMDEEGFGNCTNTGACEVECPKGISLENIARMNREYLKASFKG